MVSEQIYVLLSKDSSTVTCVFNMLNHGDDIEIPIGFPAMNFHHWMQQHPYHPSYRKQFTISVDGVVLGDESIVVPADLQPLYDEYTSDQFATARWYSRLDSLYSSLGVKRKKNGMSYPSGSYQIVEDFKRDEKPKSLTLNSRIDKDFHGQFYDACVKGDYPWYVWNMYFEGQSSKTITITYKVPTGVEYGARARYFKYIMHTGSTWFKEIESASIEIDLVGIKESQIDSIGPAIGKYTFDKISYRFEGIEPTKEDDIYVKFHVDEEVRRYERMMKKRGKKRKRRKREEEKQPTTTAIIQSRTKLPTGPSFES